MEDARLVAVSYYINREMGGPHVPFDFDGTSTLALNGLEDYRMVNDLSTKDYIVVTRGQETKIVFRGKAGDGDDPTCAANHTGNEPVITLSSTHSTKRSLSVIPGVRSRSSVIVMERPKACIYLLSTTSSTLAIDGLFGPKETQLLINRPPGAAPLELIKTTDVGVSSPAINAARVALGREITNTTLTEIAPVKTDRMAMLSQLLTINSLSNTLWKTIRGTDRVNASPMVCGRGMRLETLQPVSFLI